MLLLTAVAVCGCGLAGSGCQSTGDKSAGHFAAVEIRGNTPGQIGAMTGTVFQEHGFKETEPGFDRLVFEKPGSKMNNLAYGGWMGETPVWVRVKVSVVPIAEASFRLQCRAYLVQDKGSPIEEEKRIGNMHRGQYQKMLEEVAGRLKPK
jgi:hypothetical protein